MPAETYSTCSVELGRSRNMANKITRTHTTTKAEASEHELQFEHETNQGQLEHSNTRLTQKITCARSQISA